MCIICIEYLKGKMTTLEAIRATKEMKIDDKHKEEIKRLLDNKKEE